MKNFIKLVNFELKRFFPVYLALGILTIAIQFIGVYVVAEGHMNTIKDYIQIGTTDPARIVSNIGLMGLSRFTETLWFIAPIAICVVTLLLYTLFIWYRDWFGRNRFIYRLLMLPTNRLNLFLSKAVTIFLMVLGLLALQLILLYLEGQWFSQLIPAVYLDNIGLLGTLRTSVYLSIFYPISFIAFLSRYLMGFSILTIIFTLVLFERGFKWKGMIIGGIYAFLVIIGLLAPYLFEMFSNRNLFFPSDLFLITIVWSVLVSLLSIWISHRLLNRRITV